MKNNETTEVLSVVQKHKFIYYTKAKTSICNIENIEQEKLDT